MSHLSFVADLWKANILQWKNSVGIFLICSMETKQRIEMFLNKYSNDFAFMIRLSADNSIMHWSFAFLHSKPKTFFFRKSNFVSVFVFGIHIVGEVHRCVLHIRIEPLNMLGSIGVRRIRRIVCLCVCVFMRVCICVEIAAHTNWYFPLLLVTNLYWHMFGGQNEKKRNSKNLSVWIS